jgi:predicted AAA+ superfamily ATPase
MSQYKRQISQVLFNRLQEHVKSIIVVAGPRQIGKTTTIKQILNPRDHSSCLFLALDNPVEEPEEQDYSIENITSSFSSNVSIQKDQKWIVEKWQRARKLAQEWQLKQLQQSLNTINPTGQAPNILPFVLVFDEIHLIRNWSSIVKGLWDEDRAKDLQMHVVVLGSAPLLIQRDISES